MPSGGPTNIPKTTQRWCPLCGLATPPTILERKNLASFGSILYVFQNLQQPTNILVPPSVAAPCNVRQHYMYLNS